MSRFQQWLSTLPTINLRVLVSLSLSVVVIVAATVLLVLQRAVQQDVLATVLIFLGAMMGIDAAAWVGKRLTTRVDVMNATAAIDANTAMRTTETETKTKTTETVPGAPGAEAQ